MSTLICLWKHKLTQKYLLQGNLAINMKRLKNVHNLALASSLLEIYPIKK